MMRKITSIVILALATFIISCNSNNKNEKNQNTTSKENETDVVYVYNFHSKNRCPTCIAIEDVTKKTIQNEFSSEYKKGKIKQFEIDVDDEKNKEIAEKYQVFGSALILASTKNGKEKTIDLTGDGFKFAKSKEDKFVEILKTNINELLK